LLQDDAATSYQIAIQSNKDPYLPDLAYKAGGSYRYLIRIFDPQSATRIVRVGLLRNPDKPVYGIRKLFGWDECTQDINAGRGHSYLYLCWNTFEVDFMAKQFVDPDKKLYIPK